MADTQLQPVVVFWPTTTTSTMGSIPEFRAEIDSDVTGTFVVYRVPICDAYPSGYWARIVTDIKSNAIEPGCSVYDKKLLCKINLNQSFSLREEDNHPKYSSVIYIHPELSLDRSLINTDPSLESV